MLKETCNRYLQKRHMYAKSPPQRFFAYKELHKKHICAKRDLHTKNVNAKTDLQNRHNAKRFLQKRNVYAKRTDPPQQLFAYVEQMKKSWHTYEWSRHTCQ